MNAQQRPSDPLPMKRAYLAILPSCWSLRGGQFLSVVIALVAFAQAIPTVVLSVSSTQQILSAAKSVPDRQCVDVNPHDAIDVARPSQAGPQVQQEGGETSKNSAVPFWGIASNRTRLCLPTAECRSSCCVSADTNSLIALHVRLQI
ncbi:hypothetical protein [Roseiconus lacunae]|uniref:hypothetical protein n=1 Tax=Roseiconus lacunae TaxID=2605694 RepID=UPI001E4935B3|nr:hypothetical protein [Roseiconus lacunae]MCD0462930.1 hypothetical protein [Roseiconus lacunae]